MNKQEFLAALSNKLAVFPQAETAERLNFYSEMIDDRMEEGIPEDVAVSELGSIDEIVSQIISEIPLTKLVKEKVKPKRTLRGWEIMLLILGSPIWFSLFIAFFAIIIAIYAVIWSLLIAFWAIEVTFAACAIPGFFSCLTLFISGKALAGIAMSGAELVIIGLAIFGFFGCKQTTRGFVVLTKKIFIGIKSLFLKKEKEV